MQVVRNKWTVTLNEQSGWGELWQCYEECYEVTEIKWISMRLPEPLKARYDKGLEKKKDALGRL